MSGLADRRRQQLAVALVVLTALLLAATAIAGYPRTALVDEQEFSARATSALENADVREVVADRVVGGLTRNVVPDALVVRPLVVSGGRGAGRHQAVPAGVLAGAERSPPRADQRRHELRLRAPAGGGPGVRVAAERRAARIARAIPADLRGADPAARSARLRARTARASSTTSRAWRWPLLILSALAACGCVALAGGVRSSLLYLGAATAGAGLTVAAFVAGLDEFVVAHAAHAADLSEETERAAVHALWNALFADLRSAALLAALGGTIVAVLAAGTISSRFPDAGWRGRAGRPRLARARPCGSRAAPPLIALGAALVVEPALVGRVLVVAGGVLVALVGASQLAPQGGETCRAARERDAAAAGRRDRRRAGG